MKAIICTSLFSVAFAVKTTIIEAYDNDELKMTAEYWIAEDTLYLKSTLIDKVRDAGVKDYIVQVWQLNSAEFTGRSSWSDIATLTSYPDLGLNFMTSMCKLRGESVPTTKTPNECGWREDDRGWTTSDDKFSVSGTVWRPLIVSKFPTLKEGSDDFMLLAGAEMLKDFDEWKFSSEPVEFGYFSGRQNILSLFERTEATCLFTSFTTAFLATLAF